MTVPVNFSQLVQRRKAAAAELQRRRHVVRQAFRPARIRVLSPEEQLERFLRMTQEDFDRLVRKRGAWAVEQYVRAMQRLMENG